MVIKGKIPKPKTGKQYECENRNIGKMLSDARSRNGSPKLLGDRFNEQGEMKGVELYSETMDSLPGLKSRLSLEGFQHLWPLLAKDTSDRSPMRVPIEQIATQPY